MDTHPSQYPTFKHHHSCWNTYPGSQNIPTRASLNPNGYIMASSGYRGLPHDKYNDHLGGPVHSEGAIFPSECYLANSINTHALGMLAQNGFIHVRCLDASPDPSSYGSYACHVNSMIIAFGGACPGNGTHQAVASGFCVYFGPRGPNCLDIQQNLSSEVPDHHFYQHTKQRAELHATTPGLKSATKFATDRVQWPYTRLCDDLEQCPIYHLVIKSDSEYVVDGITKTVHKWVFNGWLTVKKKPVKNQELWMKMISVLKDLQFLGVHVDFYHVPREYNQGADLLAREGVGCGLIFTGEGLRQR